MKKIAQVFVFDMVSKVASGFISILLIRFMSSDEYATYTVILSVVAVATGTVASSFNRIYVVGYERLNLKRFSSSFLGVQILGIMLLAVILLPLEHRFRDIYWVALGLILTNCLAEYSRTFFQQQLRFLLYSLTDTLRVFIFASVVLLLLVGTNYQVKAWQVVCIQSGATLLVFIVLFGKRLDIEHLFRFREAFSLGYTVLRTHYSYLFGYFFLLAFLSQVDVFMLGIMATPDEVASYGSAFRYYMIILMVLNAFHAVLLPVIQRVNNRSDLDRIYERHFNTLLLIFPIVVCGIFASQWIIPVIDKGKYPDAIPIFRILAFSSMLSIAFSPHVNLLMRFEDFKFLLGIVIVGLVLAFSFNLVFIPSLGAIGTAWVTLITFGVVNGSFYFRAKKYRRDSVLSLENSL
jgi:O-antigen/teichoic acid export membrane protein